MATDTLAHTAHAHEHGHHDTPFPARMECSLKDEREQALFPSFPICKSSSYAVPQPGQSF